MSADICIVFFGLRYEVRPDEIEGLELRSDARVVAARKVGLKYYWGNFGGLEEKYLLFIGAQLGILGVENAREIKFVPTEVQDLFERTRAKLNEAPLVGEPSLYLQWQPDV
jgi:hypothetical protein